MDPGLFYSEERMRRRGSYKCKDWFIPSIILIVLKGSDISLFERTIRFIDECMFTKKD
jgi:hypothetical protein